MSWILSLVETYDKCQAEVGYSDEERQRPLLPLCHVTTQAQIEIAIDGNGNFRRAAVIHDKTESVTIIPSTESSAGRAGSKPENHPLCDKLQYIAADYTRYGGSVTSGFAKDEAEPFRNYTKILTQWVASPFAHPKVEAVLKYVSKRQVIRDLVEHGILILNGDGKFCTKNDIERDKNTKDIFSVIDTQEDAFVRWIVEDDFSTESRVWRDKSLWQSWTKFYLGDRSDQSLCYVTGENQLLASNHPRYIRREGDGAKLISANDSSGFTYRGRFITDEQATGVGLEASHKAHYALIWLISRQGYRKGDLAVVAWARSGTLIPQPTDDIFSIVSNIDDRDTAQELAVQLKHRIAGYGKQLGSTEKIAVMAMDSATPGRLAISYYRDLAASDFLQRIDNWHESCAWLHRYRFIDVQDAKSGKVLRKSRPFVGAPSPNDIAEAAYGPRIDDKLRKATIERILPCIVDGQPLPADLVESTVRRASNRVAAEEWEWNKTLSIACALYRKFKSKENYLMALDPNRTTRDYLYGRLLALADSLEEWALNEAGENRQTNAARLMQRFAERPYSTWRTIELALVPYKARLGGKSRKRQQMIDEVIASFTPEDFISDKRLSGEFLLGYHSQREALRASRAQEGQPEGVAEEAVSEGNSDK